MCIPIRPAAGARRALTKFREEARQIMRHVTEKAGSGAATKAGSAN